MTEIAASADQGGRHPETKRLGTGDCECLRGGAVAQPINTATSMGYVAAGLMIAARSSNPGLGRRAYGGLLTLVGLGSVAYHGPQPRGSELAHDLPIAALGVLIAVTPGARLLRHRRPLPGWSSGRAAGLVVTSAGAGAAYAAGRTESRYCDPDGWLQWHGMWHLLSAAAFALAADILYDQQEDPER